MRTVLTFLPGLDFTASLPTEADAHYAGKGVLLGAADKPIFWYRPKDAKKYRVVYADLSVRDADTPPKVPSAQPEDDLIDTFRHYSKSSGGLFPDSLDLGALTQDMAKKWRLEKGTEGQCEAYPGYDGTPDSVSARLELYGFIAAASRRPLRGQGRLAWRGRQADLLVSPKDSRSTGSFTPIFRSAKPTRRRRCRCAAGATPVQPEKIVPRQEKAGNRIYLDDDAVGHGWLADRTPAQDEEFMPTAVLGQEQAVDARAVDRVDLLTVVEYELGHVAGLPDPDGPADDVMSGVLGGGIRRNALHTDAAPVS